MFEHQFRRRCVCADLMHRPRTPTPVARVKRVAAQRSVLTSWHSIAKRVWRLDVFRSDAEADEAGGEAAEEGGAFQEPQGPRWRQRVAG